MDAIEEVASKIDIVQLINSYIPLKRAGRNFKAVCPFHSEKTPSFIVSPELQIYKCFGCGQGGNAIKFVSEYEKITFGEALRQLAEKAGVKLQDYRFDSKQILKDKLYQINHLAAEFYHYILTRHLAGKKALSYLLGRGISKDSIRFFKLGFAPQGWENLVNFLVGKKGYKQEDLEQAGLVIQSRRYYDRFRNRIIFPIFDHRGNIVGFSGRVLNGDQEAKYINSPETPIYHKSQTLYGLYQAKEAIKREDSVFIVEGEFDVITPAQVGIKNIVAVKGSSVTPDQLELLGRFTRNINFCLDADSAGQAAAWRGIQLAESQEMNIKVAILTSGKDPDESLKLDPLAFRLAFKKPIPVYDFFIKSSVSRFGQETAQAKRKVSEEVLPKITKITNEVVKAHYFKKLAQVLAVSEEAITREAQRLAIRGISKFSGTRLIQKQVKSRDEVLEEYLTSLALQSDGDLRDLLASAKIEYFQVPVVKKIFSYLVQYYQQSSKWEIKKFVEFIPAEIKEAVNRLYLSDLAIKDWVGEWAKAWNEVEKKALHDKLRTLKGRLAQGQPAQILLLEKEIIKIVQQLKNHEKTS